MKKIIISLFTVSLFLLSGITVKASDFISVMETFKMMRQKNVVIVSAQKEADYKMTHIQNSVNLNHKDLYKDGAVKSMLKSPSEIAAILGKKGISESKTIIIYDNGSGKYSGRVYWILKHLGAPNVKILNGQIKAWKAARKPITKAPTMVKPATFTPKVNSAIIASMAQAKAKKGVLVDVRSAEEFNGTKESELKKGHIPGALNIEFKQVMDAKGMVKDAAAIKSLFGGKGVTADKEVILYCESSVRAGIVYAALTSIAGYTNVKVYDGAYLEWCSTSNPVEK